VDKRIYLSVYCTILDIMEFGTSCMYVFMYVRMYVCMYDMRIWTDALRCYVILLAY